MRLADIWDIFNPLCCTKLWRVEGMNWSRGHDYYFWTKKKAFKYAYEIKELWLFIDIIDEWTGKSIRIKPIAPYPIPTLNEHNMVISEIGYGQYF